jgi:hypothetical protein
MISTPSCERAFNTPHLWASKFPSFVVALALPAYLPGGRATRLSPMLVPLAGGSSTVVNLGDFAAAQFGDVLLAA